MSRLFRVQSSLLNYHRNQPLGKQLVQSVLQLLAGELFQVALQAAIQLLFVQSRLEVDAGRDRRIGAWRVSPGG